ncbi:helicase-related protein [Beijerinckia indica]|uniref:Helicase domain protein n=1 Tax=Beijerinckia indica subsp. indica (strain ATCC 9039 / DSM 1715 / NCIMB 8712) TaxID=395963 RepID=B2IB33_BEII9|nr:helicase-related protein [Beijerinckia indica]ACB93733.1 helicase domain protein [Beijerinckia indica subsp. indica ATCC 9039]
MTLLFPATRLHRQERAKGVSILLGPTNTGKTHHAIERMLAHPSGMIGLPLRLLAREVYHRVVEKAGLGAVALITGEEKIKPATARYWISTVEAMPRDLDLSFVAIDEIQLASDLDRGHVFTDRLLNRRGRDETLLIGAATMQRALAELLPGAHFLARPRLSKLSFAGEKKMARLPRRSAIVAFSAEEVYAIAEWIRRQRGGAAVVLGALSPRTRNAQVEMYQNGEVDYIVATDAIGMGLNLDVDHIAFAADRKFDGWHYRRLTPAEFGQIAGRAGRHLRDGTFGTTGRCAPFDEDLIEALEEHRFDSVNMLQWRNTDLDFSSLADLAGSLDMLPKEPRLTRAPLAVDQLVLDVAARDATVQRTATNRGDIARLWECCQIPDYRKLSPAAHSELVLAIYGFVVRAGRIPEDWLARQIEAVARVDGDIDALSARIAQCRTWTFVANRSDWLADPRHWQGVTRQVEDTLSDALHERLAQRFVDRRTSVLMRRLRENAIMEAEITTNGEVMVEGQHVGQLNGFRFTADPQAEGEAAKALAAAAQKALASEIESRANRVHEAVDEAFVLANDGIIRWLGEPVGKIIAGEHVLEPRVRVIADEHLTGPSLEQVQRRLELWLAQHVKKYLGPLAELERSEGLEGIARGIAFQVAEALGVLERAKVADEVKNLAQETRAALRKFGIRFGAYHLYLPALLKPAPRALAAQLWALKNGGVEELKGLDEVPHLAASGRTSFVADKDVPKGFYRAAGFRVCGDRAVRVDILERLADLIRPAVSYRPGTTPGEPPAGTADGDGFVVTVAMTSLAGCSGESFGSILRSLGYQSEQRKGPPITHKLVPLAATEPVQPTLAGEAASAETVQADATSEDSAQATQINGAQIDVTQTDSAQAEGAATVAVEEPGLTTVAESPAAASGEASAESAPENEPATETADASSEASTEPATDEAKPAESETVETEAAGTSEPVVVEEVLIEVWRPHRQNHARRPDNRGRRPHQEGASAEAGQHRPKGRGDHRQGPHQGAHRAPHQGAPAEISGLAGSPAGQEAGQGQEHAAHAPVRDDQKRDDQKQQRRGHQNRPAGERSGQNRPNAQRPPQHRSHQPRTGENGERGQGRGHFSTEKRSAERAIDPNSPFAKLAALKAQLEDKNK